MRRLVLMGAVAEKHGDGSLQGDAVGETFDLCVEPCHLFQDEFSSALRRVRTDDVIEYIHPNLLR